MINLNNINSLSSTANLGLNKTNNTASPDSPKTNFSDAVKSAGKYISNVDDVQQTANLSIKDLLTGKSEDITSVVSAMAKADISFKVLVGVRNKLIEAYKQTMNMQV